MKHFGRFKILVENTVTNTTEEFKEQDNLVLDKIFSVKEAANYHYYVYCLFGTGSTEASRTDVSLANPVSSYISARPEGFIVNRKIESNKLIHETEMKFTGGQGAIQGNISELGVSYKSDSSGLSTRALIRDELGNPATLTLGPFDILTVIYTLGYELDFSNPLLATKTIDVAGEPVQASLYAAGYDLNDRVSLWSTGSSVDKPDIASFKPFPLSASYLCRYVRPFSGNITNFGDFRSQVTDLGRIDQDSTNVASGGSFDSASTYYPSGIGNRVGMWNGLAFMYENTSLSESRSRPCFVILFDPPIEKGPNDVIKIESTIIKTFGV